MTLQQNLNQPRPWRPCPLTDVQISAAVNREAYPPRRSAASPAAKGR